MIKAIYQIIKNWQANRRYLYRYESANIYDKSYYLTLCGDYELYKTSQGRRLSPILKMMIELAKPKKGQQALDVGCGRGEICYALAKAKLKVVGIDLSPDAIKLSLKTCQRFIATQDVKIIAMNATKLKFPQDSFDLLMAGDLVEHLSDRDLRKFLSEAHRVLKKDGKLVIHTLPTVNYKRIGQYLVQWYFGLRGISWQTITSREEVKFGHINIHSQTSLKAYLARSFTPKKIQVFYAPANNHGFLKKLVGKLGLWKILSHHLWAIAEK